MSEMLKKRDPNRFTVLAAEIASPQVVAAIDRALEENELERIELIDFRKVAVRLHGDPSATATSAEETPIELINKPDTFNLKVADLIARYKTTEESGYSKLRFRTRENYDGVLRRLERDLGREQIKNLDRDRIWAAYEEWAEGGHITMAYSIVRMLRQLVIFGARTLKSKECRDLRFTLSEMKFPTAKGQSERLSREGAAAIIAKAHEMRLPSIALAQAFQFECGLAQRDVIGEWIPESEPGEPILFDGDGHKWLRGIRWDEIKDSILRHPRSRDGVMLDIKLSEAETPLLMKELARYPNMQGKRAPIILDPLTELPFNAWTYRSEWRKIARACGIPDHVKNMDSKGG